MQAFSHAYSSWVMATHSYGFTKPWVQLLRGRFGLGGRWGMRFFQQCPAGGNKGASASTLTSYLTNPQFPAINVACAGHVGWGS